MTTLPRLAAGVVALALAIAPIAAASAASASAASAAPRGDAAPAPGAPTTWSVVPAGTQGADGRQAFSYSVPPGSLLQDEVAVANRGTVAETFHFSATDAFTDRDTGAFSLLVGSATPKDVGAWSRLSASSQVIEPGQELRIPFQISVPTDATPGDYTGGVLASVYVDSGSGKAGVKVEERVAARVYLHVIGPEVAKVTSSGQSSGFSPSVNPFATGTSEVAYDVKNIGNVRVDVRQTIVVNGPFGIPIAHFPGRVVRNLLPGDSVHQTQRVEAWPALLLWTSVKLAAEKPTDTVQAAEVRDLTGQTASATSAPRYVTTSTDSVSGAFPVTLLLGIAVIVAAGWLVVRYVRMSRERVYAAIEDAARELAERERLESGLRSAEGTRLP